MKKAISLLVFLTCLSQLCYGVSEEERKANWDKIRQIKRDTTLVLHPTQGEVTSSPNIAEPGSELAQHFSAIYLIRIIAPDDREIYKLDITARYRGEQWLNYQLAARKEGGGLKLKTVSRQENCDSAGSCLREERVEVALSFVDLANNIGGRGLDIVLRGEQDRDIHISSLYLLAMMQTMTAFDP